MAEYSVFLPDAGYTDGTDGFPAWLAYQQADGARDLDVAFGRLLAEQVPALSETVLRLAVLCSAQLAHGHPCLDLAALYADPHAVLLDAWQTQTSGERPSWLPVDPSACRQALSDAPCVGDGTGGEPLVLHGQRLYLARYWRAGQRIRTAIHQRLALAPAENADADRVRHWLDALFPAAAPAALDWQKVACTTALLYGFSIITGGPGTGKTTTVVRLLAVLQALAQTRGLGQGLRIRLAAPTGKAAARLNESIAGALGRLARDADAPLQAALACVPAEVTTVHRLLGSRPDTRRPAFHAGRPLDLDVLVVDEASMMDIEMMDAVLAALPPSAQLVLLGDKDQLASVEAGAVLGELCARADAGHYQPAHCAHLGRLCGQAPGPQWQDPDGTVLDQAVVMLRHSHRFLSDSGIGRFASAVNDGDLGAVGALLAAPPEGLRIVRAGLAARQPPLGRHVPDWLMEAGVLGDSGYPALFSLLRSGRPETDAPAADWDCWARQILTQQTRFQLLCALRTGTWGTQGLNQLIEARLRAAGLLPFAGGEWYPGRPVLVLRNQPSLGLANGDIGVVLPVPDPDRPAASMLRVAFAGTSEQAVRWVSPARLPAIETVYALTVHKSQGSEFNQVVLVLPDRPGPLLTRELLYTGATRARTSLTLVLPGPEHLLDHAVRHRTQRAGGVWNL